MNFLLRPHLSLYHITILLCLGYMLTDHVDSQTIGSSNLSCIDSERRALFNFKKSLVLDSKHNLSDWSHENMDCCRWEGIRCSKAGHVVAIDLHGPRNYDEDFYQAGIGGEISSSLVHLSYLNYLDLSNNDFTKVPEFIGSLKRLRYLNLSNNHLMGKVPHQLGNLSVLETLDLARNDFEGSLVQLLQQSSNLIELDVSKNHFNGTLTGIPFSKFSALQVLNLAGNKFTGSLAQLLQQSSNLIKLDVTSNHFSGTLTESLFQNLTNLQVLSLSFNSLTLSFSTGFTPPFQLHTLRLRECKLGKIFPHWLRTQKNLKILDISNSGISDATPSWFWNISPQLEYLDVSNNTMSGSLPPNTLPTCLYINLGSNRFNGTLPSFSKTLSLLASNNSFSGEITSFCGLIGSVFYLDLSNNFLSGVLPNCFDSRRLTFLILNNNKFTGSLPNSIGNAGNLTVLRLQNNCFSGCLPQFLQNCTSLSLLDLGENHLSGTIPDWIGTNLTNLIVLRLRSNNFVGNIPSSLCHLKSLQILDLSENHLAGIIPSCLDHLTSMMTNDENLYSYIGVQLEGEVNMTKHSMLEGNSASVFWKGLQREYLNTKGIQMFKYFDLSNNILSGLIPEEVTSLVDLDVLRLSNNVLIGRIPSQIGKMRMLEFLDLSHNYISGEIPSSMADLSTLNYLNLSYNNLTGRIPQLLTMNATMFLGNEGLCGDPLPKCHHGENVNNDLPNIEGGDDNENMGMYISIVLGFIVGFWGVCGTLLVKYSWAQKYFQFLIYIHERLHVTILIGLASLRRRFAS